MKKKKPFKLLPMKIQSLFSLILFCSLTFIANAQFTAKAFIEKGIALHDKGEYTEAIDQYEKALAIDPDSDLINYEIALSYYAMGNYKKSIKFSNKVLNGDSPHKLSAYITKGNSLDMLGKTKKSIKVFEKAIVETDGHYLLNYNLGVNYYKKYDFENAEKHAIGAAKFKRDHGSSHLMIANTNFAMANKVKAILSSHFFLLLEPDSHRSQEAYDILIQSFNANVSQSAVDDNSINIVLSDGTLTKEFGMQDMMVSLMKATNLSDENKGKSDSELFIENNESLFLMLGESKDDSDTSVWYDLYIDFYYELVKSEHFETYMHYIQQSFKEESKIWLEQNQDKLKAYDIWLNEYR